MTIDQAVAHLRGQHAAGRLVVIVGAGVSILSTEAPTASWTGLLRHGIDRLSERHPELDDAWAARKRCDLDSGRLVEMIATAGVVAEYLRQLGAKSLSEWLYEALGQLPQLVKERSVLDALRELDAPLATTNYDGLLEHVTGREAITWDDAASVKALLRGEEKPVLHVHGYYRRASTIVLDLPSYHAILRDEAAQFALRSLLADRCLLFVGCGGTLMDPNFATLRQWMRRAVSGIDNLHYRACRDGEEHDLASREALEDGIVPLVYGQRPQQLASTLRQIAGSDD